MDAEAAAKEEARNQLSIVQKKLSQAYAELDEVRAVLDATTRSKQSLEQELAEVQDRINDLNMQLGSLANAKRKIEGDYASLTRCEGGDIQTHTQKKTQKHTHTHKNRHTKTHTPKEKKKKNDQGRKERMKGKRNRKRKKNE